MKLIFLSYNIYIYIYISLKEGVLYHGAGHWRAILDDVRFGGQVIFILYP
jgi:hypothetical protein